MSGKPPWTTTEIVLSIIVYSLFFGCFILLVFTL